MNQVIQTVFDIETVPLASDRLDELIDPFDEATVKVGNLVDPEKVRAKIDKARAEHTSQFLAKAALSPLTAQVAAIGLKTKTDQRILQGEEPKIIESFFYQFDEEKLGQWIGFNIAGFDIPFLMRRAWALGVPLPTKKRLVKGRSLSHWFVDLAEVWRATVYEKDLISLDRLARYLGVGSKNGQTGAGFAALLYESKEAALSYLANDLELTWAIADRLGVIDQEPAVAAAEAIERAKEQNGDISYF